MKHIKLLVTKFANESRLSFFCKLLLKENNEKRPLSDTLFKKIFIIFIFLLETWILYRGNDEGVSNVVKEGYKNYETIEFGIETKKNNDPLQHIKLISTLEKKVCSLFLND